MAKYLGENRGPQKSKKMIIYPSYGTLIHKPTKSRSIDIQTTRKVNEYNFNKGPFTYRDIYGGK